MQLSLQDVGYRRLDLRLRCCVFITDRISLHVNACSFAPLFEDHAMHRDRGVPAPIHNVKLLKDSLQNNYCKIGSFMAPLL